MLFITQQSLQLWAWIVLPADHPECTTHWTPGSYCLLNTWITPLDRTTCWVINLPSHSKSLLLLQVPQASSLTTRNGRMIEHRLYQILNTEYRSYWTLNTEHWLHWTLNTSNIDYIEHRTSNIDRTEPDRMNPTVWTRLPLQTVYYRQPVYHRCSTTTSLQPSRYRRPTPQLVYSHYATDDLH
jgi:hypothetical protein